MSNIDQYKKGNMTVEELETFTNTFMRAKYDNDRRKKWQSKLNEQHGVNRDTPSEKAPAKIRNMYKWVVVIAAAVLLLLVSKPLMQSFISPSYEQLAEAFIDENFYENQGITKGDQDIEQLNLEAIFAYNEKDFATAINSYEAIITKGQATEEQYFFLALSYLYNDQYNLAISNLQIVINLNPNGKFKQETQWFLALSYLQNKDIATGKRALLSITEGQWNYDKAQQLLEAIE